MKAKEDEMTLLGYLATLSLLFYNFLVHNNQSGVIELHTFGNMIEDLKLYDQHTDLQLLQIVGTYPESDPSSILLCYLSLLEVVHMLILN